MTAMLTVHPHGTFNAGFDLVDEVRGPVGTLAGSAWREGGRVHVGPQEYGFRKDGGRRFALTGPGGGQLAGAERTSFWTSAWRVTTADRAYDLVKPSLWRSRYEVRQGGQVVGTLDRRGFLRSRAEVTLPPDLPPPVQVFVVAVVLTQWRRDSSAAAGGASAG